ncbi:MAG: ATP-binding cassette domain-containing protein [Faecalibacterium sp.]
MEETILTAKDLKFRYDPEQPDYALNGVSAEVKRGEFVAVLGANGCGKSTLAKHFNAILLPESGTVLVEGMDTKETRTRSTISARPWAWCSRARTTRSLPPWWRKMSPLRWKIWVCRRKRCAAAWMEAMKMAGIYEYRERAPHNLSGGQKQRVAIAGVVAMRPDCLIAGRGLPPCLIPGAGSR